MAVESIFTNNVEGCLDVLYDDIRDYHDDIVDDGSEFTEVIFNERFEEQIHEEIDSTVNVMYASDLDAIIEEIGWIKLVRIYRDVYGNLDGLFDESDIDIKRKLIYQSLYEAVMEKKDFEIYMDIWKAEKEIERNDPYYRESDDFNLRGEEGYEREGEIAKGEETDLEGEGEETEEDE